MWEVKENWCKWKRKNRKYIHASVFLCEKEYFREESDSLGKGLDVRATIKFLEIYFQLSSFTKIVVSVAFLFSDSLQNFLRRKYEWFCSANLSAPYLTPALSKDNPHLRVRQKVVSLDSRFVDWSEKPIPWKNQRGMEKILWRQLQATAIG